MTFHDTSRRILPEAAVRSGRNMTFHDIPAAGPHRLCGNPALGSSVPSLERRHEGGGRDCDSVAFRLRLDRRGGAAYLFRSPTR